MRKIVMILVALSMVLTLTACAQIQESTSSTPQDSSEQVYRQASFTSMEDFTAYMNKTDFDNAEFFNGSGPHDPHYKYYHENYYMFKADKCYYIPKISTENVTLDSIYISAGGAMGFYYYTKDKKELLFISISTNKKDNLAVTEKLLLAMAEESTKGYAPDVKWSSHLVKGEKIAISSENEIAFTAGDYIAKMCVLEVKDSLIDYLPDGLLYDSSVKEYAEMVTFERVSLK